MVIFEDIVFDRKSDNVFSMLLVGCIVAMIYSALAFTIGDNGPSGFAESAPVVFVLGLIAGFFAYKKRGGTKSILRIEQTKDRKYKVEVLSPSGTAVISFGSPFAYRCGYDLIYLGKGRKQRMLYFVLSSADGTCLLTLQSFVGMLEPLPDDWPQLTNEDMAVFDHLYRTKHVKEIANHFIYKENGPVQKNQDLVQPDKDLTTDPLYPAMKIQESQSKDSDGSQEEK